MSDVLVVIAFTIGWAGLCVTGWYAEKKGWWK